MPERVDKRRMSRRRSETKLLSLGVEVEVLAAAAAAAAVVVVVVDAIGGCLSSSPPGRLW